MSEPRISAEVEPHPGEARAAAARLDRTGFQIHHVGTTISVEGPRSLWEETFGVTFEEREKPTTREVEDAERSYYRARTDAMEIPAHLRPVIAEIYFSEPPEFF